MSIMHNPIKTVDGVAIKCPSIFKWKLEDLSAADAGRTESYEMDKARVGQIVGIDLKWRNVTTAEASVILNAFNPEYITVEYLDPMQGAFRTSVFYVGNRSAPLYNGELGLWTDISFSIIERTATQVEGDERNGL